MIHKKQLAQFEKNILRSQKGLQNHQLMHPDREWTVGLCIALGIFLASAIWSALAYVEYSSDNIVINGVLEVQPVVYREAQVKGALDIFKQKSGQLDILLKNSIDPTEESVLATSSVSATEAAISTASSTQEAEVSTTTVAVIEADSTQEIESGESLTQQEEIDREYQIDSSQPTPSN